MDTMQPAPEPFWHASKDEELLALRICDLGVQIENSELKPRIEQLYSELAARGVALRPNCYLGDEWFSPEGVPDISMPSHRAHPPLRLLALHQMLGVEGGTAAWCQLFLPHECGHSADQASRFSPRTHWPSISGTPQTESSPETSTPRPYSKSSVRHLP